MKKRGHARPQRQREKKARHAARRQEKKRSTVPARSRGKAVVHELLLRAVPDERARCLLQGEPSVTRLGR